MPKLVGVFDSFEDLEHIPIENVQVGLNSPQDITTLEDYLANRVFYPQAAPLTKEEITLDLKILIEGLKQNSSFLKGKKIIIPEDFTQRFPDLGLLVWAFVQAYNPKEALTVVLAGKGEEILGTILPAEFKDKKSIIEISIDKKTHPLKAGFSVFPCQENSQVHYFSTDSQILGQSEGTITVFGGRLGLAIDGRLK